ncbi:MAG: hypothetical protein KDE27_16830 [Planctomycetes bacterium]|nr:hypothetical protein [Planctomycetota bacterium]
MKNLSLAFSALALGVTDALSAQQTLLFTGRFPFVGLDAPNERPGGAINDLSRYSFSYVTPGAGAFARSLLPATAMQCYIGDANNNDDYLKFDELATQSYFANFQIGGLFVKWADRANVTWDRIYFTVRDNEAGADLEVFTNNGTGSHTLVPGDWVRFLPNGNVEFFMTAADLAIAAGPPNTGGSSIDGCHTLVQTATGDLFYSPVQGGHWVNGNQGGPVFANDGSIIKIAAADISYDPISGNIASFVPNSARLCIEEVNAGSSSNSRTIRSMIGAAGAFDNQGLPILGTSGNTVLGKISGLGLDPLGGTFTTTFPDAAGNYTTEPDLIFTADSGRYAGTIFSTANNGSIATINGQLCGSNLAGVPATGAWLGVQLDVPNFQPTVMGLTLVDALEYEPLLLDAPNNGVIDLAASQPSFDLDLNGAPTTLAFLVLAFGPNTPGLFPPSVPLSAIPVGFVDSHADVFTATNTVTIGLLLTDPNGYAAYQVANPNVGGYTNIRFVIQAAAALNSGGVQVSTPVITELR